MKCLQIFFFFPVRISGLTCNADITLLCQSNWPCIDHGTLRHAIFISPPFHFNHSVSDVNIKLYVLECGRYTINLGIPPIQNTQIVCTEVASCLLMLNCSADLDFTVLFLLIGSVWPNVYNVHRTLKASEWFTSSFPVVSLCSVCLLVLIASNTNSATVTLNLNQSQEEQKCLRILFWNAIHEQCSWWLYN